MSLTWKIILLLAVATVGSAAVVSYKNNSAKQSNEAAENSQKTEDFSSRTYDPKAKPITDMDINLLIKDAGNEPSAETEEADDSVLINSDKDELNNFDKAYVSTDF